MKNRSFIKVPLEVRYLSDFKGFELPNGILQKKLTGCGGTTLALEDNHPTIICSPRTKLLENKNNQYPNTLFVKAGVSDIDIENYIIKERNECRVPKILTTYDSFIKIKRVIKDELQDWRIVVDEFQYLLGDASFKLLTEMWFLQELRDCPYVTYLSATPILDKYIDNIKHFNDVDYYELDWDDSVVEKVNVIDVQTNNPKSYASKLIKKYKAGQYIMNDDIEAKEVVFFVNSVKTIVNLINNNNLSADEVNIIVADNERNSTLLKKLGEDYTVGYIPLKGENHKMFTFCTSTAYAGIDMYSTCAVSVVISDCHSQNTSVDIATDLVQIAGRQRLKENPFRNDIIFVYNVNPIKDSNEDSFNKEIQHKLASTLKLVKTYNEETDVDVRYQMYKMYIGSIDDMKYENYMFYNDETKEYEVNDLSMVNDKFCYDIQNEIFKNGLAVRKQLESTFGTKTEHQYIRIEEAFKMLIEDTTFEDDFRKYCELRDAGNHFASVLVKGNRDFEDYYTILGSKKCRALAYKEARLKKEMKNLGMDGQIEKMVKREFKIGISYTKKNIKAKLTGIYKALGLTKTAKATDLEKYFDLSRTSICMGNKKNEAFLIKEKKGK